MQVSESFRILLEKAIGHDNMLVALSALDTPASVSVRLNPFKKGCAPEGRMIPWSRYGRILEHRPLFTLDPIFHAGGYYVQDSSSMFVGHVFRSLMKDRRLPEGRPLRVLDLCAAPGGKTTDLAASLREICGDRFLLVANEVMKSRVGVLADNVAVWGDPNVMVTSDDPVAFASLEGFFDVIVADVPCSGEGMFRKDEQARMQWSEDNVALCQARQRRIIADVWPALATDGVLIYSTCTFNRNENDSNVEWIAENLNGKYLLPSEGLEDYEGVIRTDRGYSLVPGLVEGEGQYCSALVKAQSDGQNVGFARRERTAGKGKESCVPCGVREMLSTDVELRWKGEVLTAVPKGIYPHVALAESVLHVVAAGCALGTVKGKDFIPDADLALSLILEADAFVAVDVDLDTALAFLHRDAIVLADAQKGFLLVRYEGLPLGFVKNLGNRCNNLHPQGRRIRMDIKRRET